MSFLKITDPKKRDEIVRDYLATKNNIRSQDLSTRADKQTSQQELEEYFKPITEAQKDMTTSINQLVKKPITITYPQQQIMNLPQESIQSSSVQSYGPLATEAFYKTLEPGHEADTVFGIYTKNGKSFIGNKKVEINSNDDIIIEDNTYTGTPGLWELIRSSQPKDYTSDDLKVYSKILHQTSAIKRNNDPNSHFPKSNRSSKWRNIIKPIWDQRHLYAGSGTFLPQDPDALINRLELLMASRQAGNTGVVNELVSIIDELYRQKVISKQEYKKLSLRV